MPKEFQVDDSKSTSAINNELINFQKELLKEVKILQDQVVTDEFNYMKSTIQTKHGKKYNVLMAKTEGGWIVFPDRYEIATQEEFGLNFPIWRKLYMDYKKAERTQ